MLIAVRLEVPDERPVARSRRIAARHIGRDGFSLASQWSDAPASFFVHDWQSKPLTAPISTRVQLLHGDHLPYLRFICRYAILSTFARDGSAREIYPPWERDVVELFLQALADAGSCQYLALEVAPNGLLLELQVAGSGHKRLLDHSHAKPAVDTRHRVWSAELAVPMAGAPTLLRSADGWLLNLFRPEGQGAQRSYSAWSPTRTARANFHVPGAFGRLKLDDGA